MYYSSRDENWTQHDCGYAMNFSECVNNNLVLINVILFTSIFVIQVHIQMYVSQLILNKFKILPSISGMNICSDYPFKKNYNREKAAYQWLLYCQLYLFINNARAILKIFNFLNLLASSKSNSIYYVSQVSREGEIHWTFLFLMFKRVRRNGSCTLCCEWCLAAVCQPLGALVWRTRKRTGDILGTSGLIIHVIHHYLEMQFV